MQKYCKYLYAKNMQTVTFNSVLLFAALLRSAKILPAAVVATGSVDAVLNELAALLLQLQEVGLLVEDVVDYAMEQ